jgi:hypothetical protein
VKHADSVGQSLLVLELTLNVRMLSGLPTKIGETAHRSTAHTTMRPTTFLFTAVTPGTSQYVSVAFP